MRESRTQKSFLPKPEFERLAFDEQIQRTVTALESNNIRTFLAHTGREAKLRVLDLLPLGAEVFTATSKTLEDIGVVDEISGSGHYVPLRSKISELDRKHQEHQIRLIAATPDYVVGSVHAITERGEIMIASTSGTQLASYSSGARILIWVASTTKIVKDLGEGFRRIEEYAYPLEDARTRKAHNRSSDVNKVLIVNIRRDENEDDAHPCAGKVGILGTSSQSQNVKRVTQGPEVSVAIGISPSRTER